jgi:hypothetical protein
METIQWYVFSGSNTEKQYGFGCESDADLYLEILNENREIDLYKKEILTDISIQKQLEADQIPFFDIDEVLHALY